MADIFGVRVTPELDTINSLVICNKPDGQVEPTICFGQANYYVAWYDQFGARTINATRVTPQGQVLNQGNNIGDGSCGPDIASDSIHCLAVWSKEYYGVCGRFVDSLAQPVTEIRTISITEATSTVPKIEFGNENYLVVWPDFYEANLDIFGQFISPEDSLIGEQIKIAQGPEIQNSAVVGFDGTNFLVVWLQGQGPHGVFGQFVSTKGELMGSKFQISSDTLCYRQNPAIGVSPDNYFIAWSEFHTDLDIYGNLDITLGITEPDQLDKTFASTIIAGPLSISNTAGYDFYNVAGRRVDMSRLAPGVYFIKLNNQPIRKIVKVR